MKSYPSDLRIRFFASDKTEAFFELVKSKARPKNPSPQFLIESTKIEKSLKSIKSKIIDLEKNVNMDSCFNTDQSKLNQETAFVSDQIKENQNRINCLTNFYEEMRSNKQSEIIIKSVSEILQTRIVEATQHFKKILQKRSENIKQMEEKKQKYQKYSSISTTKRGNYGKNKPMFLKIDNESQVLDIENHTNGSTASNDSTNNDDFRPVSIQEEEVNIIQTRAGTMKNIESMIKETAQVFQRLGNIVKMQEVMIDRIDKDTDDALQNVEKGRKILTQTYRDISSNRGLILRVLAILFIFATIYVVFLL